MLYGDIVLASASPRRKELLSLITQRFRVEPSRFDESSVPSDLSPVEYVTHSSLMKAREVANRYPDALVIGADTIVVIDNTILGKPRNAADAAKMLRSLSDKTHQVYTGLAVICNGKEINGFECTDVSFRLLNNEIISRYVSTMEPMDKAGAYAIQGKGAVLIKGIRGCYFNVVGLPIYKLSTFLEEFGIEPLEVRE